ncbi:NmrA family NAD(P)-binding protein [Streptomyces sp. NPDC059215]|uniref:NmrA family NAD(P)-binding protein n=1 Tax=Streptomyces sp. NPDC059215 TaxID=3346772 RepID=UPI0036B9743A
MDEARKKILVTGATGKTGVFTTKILLDRGHEVRALVHRMDDRSQRLADAGATIVEGDLLDLSSVVSATQGIDTAYFTYPIIPGLVEASANFAQAAKEARLDGIVNMSQISARRDAVSNAARNHWVAEQVFDQFPVPATHLRPTFFAEWLIAFWNGGDIRLPFADGRHAPIAAEDQAHVIAAILEDPAPHAGEVYPLYGPVEANHAEIAKKLSRALGVPATYTPISLEDFTEALKGMDFGDHTIQHLHSVAIDYRNGVFSGTNDLVERVGKKKPLTVEEFADRNREFFEDRSSWNHW